MQRRHQAKEAVAAPSKPVACSVSAEKEKAPKLVNVPLWFDAVGWAWVGLTFLSVTFDGSTPFRHMLKHQCYAVSNLCLYPLSISKPWSRAQWVFYFYAPLIDSLGGFAHYAGINLHAVEIFLTVPATLYFVQSYKGRGERPWLVCGALIYPCFTTVLLASLGMGEINCDQLDYYSWPWNPVSVGALALGVPYTAFWFSIFFECNYFWFQVLYIAWPLFYCSFRVYGDLRDLPKPEACLGYI